MISKAVRFAVNAHAKQLRKGSEAPYIIHPVAVGLLLAQAGCDEETIIAGLLHDTVEDAHVSYCVLKKEFGCEVSDIVRGFSEPDRSKPWEERKKHTIHLMSCPETAVAIKLVTCADKLDNIRAIAADYRAIGDQLWVRFNAGKERQCWYYTSLVHSLKSLEQDPRGKDMYQQFAQAVSDVFNCQNQEDCDRAKSVDG